MPRSAHASVMIIAFAVTFFLMSFCDTPKHNYLKRGIITPGEVLPAMIPRITAIGGYMDTLYIDIPTFLRLAPKKRKLVFKYYITADDSLTLCGWRTIKKRDNYKYDIRDELVLKNGAANLDMPVGPGSFLGGVVLTKDDVGTIRNFIAAHSEMRFVLFKPQKDTTYTGHVYYDIFLTDYEPTPGIIHTFTAPLKVGVGANPSPPRNS